ncbi:hypothetical protein HYPSUDRAFT_522124 [Hypholoma sublateritium FD-334 SS-4]|uniref:Uncharacterized protein n=1 Tax=Hypholoma sublateritium (strain FD-334 SS-4) TaxID=945553 RepID=A0A0D2PMD0_HYPSF|nr:hypothetical protein HYPSUDRAFT_522124 [Hypholoma sublateritium FD-334 SS-4]
MLKYEKRCSRIPWHPAHSAYVHARSFSLLSRPGYQSHCSIYWSGDSGVGDARTRKYDTLLKGDLSLLLDSLHSPNHGPEFFGFDAGDNFRGGLKYTKLDPSVISALDRTLSKGTNINTLEIYSKTATNVGFIQNTPRIVALDSMGMDDSFDAADLLHLEDDPIHRARFQACTRLRKMHFTLVNSVAALPEVINTVINIAGCLQILHIQFAAKYTHYVEAPPNSQFPFHLLVNLTSLHISRSEGFDAVLPFLPILDICTFPPVSRASTFGYQVIGTVWFFGLHRYPSL